MLSPSPSGASLPAAPFLGSQLDGLGVTVGEGGGRLRVWSGAAAAIDLLVFDDTDLDWITATAPLTRGEEGVWEVVTEHLRPGARYALSVDGPTGPGNTFYPETMLIDPYSRGLMPVRRGEWRSVVLADEPYDWEGVEKPRTWIDHTVIYEGHVMGLTKRHPGVPPALHGTYAGLGHPAMTSYLTRLGITAVELLPVHAFETEPRLLAHGLTNYWGYNTLNFFTPHGGYATAEALAQGPDAIRREFRDMVKALHAAGIEVILDVVYNHTSELSRGGPRSSFRGIDNRAYYRQEADGTYIDVTGCGNSVNTATDAAARLVLDSLRYWANDMQVDGFRFDLAATLGRDAHHVFTPDHPLLEAIVADPALADVKRIAEPWDVGLGGWQSGNFRKGWSEWNDGYRDRVRNFWLSDIDYMRRAGASPAGVARFATRLAGSSNTFSADRGPRASVNFVTAHDGFTLHDLVSYDVKHNMGNGEQGRDGTDTNRSFNHGVEGPTSDDRILAARRRAMRNLLGTLLLSAGIPMITAGDEFGRTQRGNNNAYCHSSPLTWLDWDREDWQEDLTAHAQRLIRLRAENPALRPRRFANDDGPVPNASVIEWYDRDGTPMTPAHWNDPGHRTLQYDASSTPEYEAPNRILLVVHGTESPTEVTLPDLEGVSRFVRLWSSEPDRPEEIEVEATPGERVTLHGPAMLLFRVE